MGTKKFDILQVWQKWRVAIVAALAFLVLLMIGFFTFNLSLFNPVKDTLKTYSMTDYFWQIQQATDDYEHSCLITLVDMTELTERSDIAMALEAIEFCEPKVIGVDMVFPGLKEDTVGDNMIRDVAATYPNIIWSLKFGDKYAYDDETGCPSPIRSFFAEETGCKEAVTEMQCVSVYNRMKRKLVKGWKVQGKLLPSFIGQVVNDYAEREVVPTEDSEAEISFRPVKFDVVSCDSILQYRDLLTGRIVLFGAMHEDTDMHQTPLGTIAGLELLAYGVNTMVQANQVKRVNGVLLWGISFLIVMFTFWGRSLRKAWVERQKNIGKRLFFSFPIISSFISFAWVALLMYLAFLLFARYGISFNLGYALSAMAFLGTAEGSYKSILDYIKDVRETKKQHHDE